MMFNLNNYSAYFIGALISSALILNGSLIGFSTKRKNLIKEIGKHQAIFILAAMAGYFISQPIYEAILLNLSAGMIITSIFSAKAF